MSWTTNVAVRALLLSIGIAGIPLALVGCDNLLKVSNPSSLQEAQLDEPALEGLLVNGAIAEFQYAFTNCPMAEFLMMSPKADTIVPLFGDLFVHEPVPADGWIDIPDRPGWGVELNRTLKLKRPYEH